MKNKKRKTDEHKKSKKISESVKTVRLVPEVYIHNH